MDAELLDALTAAVTATDRALLITGAGSSFSAGVDLRRILDGGPDYAADFLTALSRMFRAVFDHPRPTVAAVNGHAIAGGCVLALACDIRLMSAGRIGLAELAVGVPFPVAALEIVRHALGPRAGRVLLGADTVGPEQALALGLVDEVTGPDDLLPAGWDSPRSWRPGRPRPTGWPRSGCTARPSRRSRRRPRTSTPPSSPAGPPPTPTAGSTRRCGRWPPGAPDSPRTRIGSDPVEPDRRRATRL